jgi:hypothetical protein
MVWLRIVVGVLLIAHGLVHLLYLAPDTPFSLEKSWVVPEGSRRPVAYALMAATILAFLLVTLALWGVPGLSSVWPAVTIVAATLSLVLLVAFWNAQLVFGIVIDLALLAAAIIRPDWVERFVA